MIELFKIILILIASISPLLAQAEAPKESICSPTQCYKVIRELGQGAFGMVYAVENAGGEPYAIKCHKRFTDKDVFFSISLFADAEREFERGQILNHPHIIKSFELFTSDSPLQKETTNLVLEYVDGNTLYKTQKNTLTGRESLEAVLHFLEALRYAFSLELMHFDLHEGNIMLNHDHDIKVIDLASFYSFDEFTQYVEEETTYLELKPMKMFAQSFQANTQSDPLHIKNLKAFFALHPEILYQMQTANKVDNVAMGLLDKRAAVTFSTAETTDKLTLLSPMHAYYFQRITEICMQIIKKSDISRQVRKELRAKMESLAWDYKEDIEEGKKAEFTQYLDQLIEVLMTAKI